MYLCTEKQSAEYVASPCMQCAMKEDFCYAMLALIKEVNNANVRCVMLSLINSEKE